MKNKNTGLRRQLVTRFVAVLVLVVIIENLVVQLVYTAWSNQLHEQRSEQASEYLARSFEIFYESWARTTYFHASQIKRVGKFETRTQAEQKSFLDDYFQIQEREFNRFSSGAVLNSDGSPLYSFGPQGEALEKRLHHHTPSWIRFEHQYRIYAVLETTLPLSESEDGTLLLLQPIDSATLRLLATFDTDVLLVHDNKVMASSRSDLDLGVSVHSISENIQKGNLGEIEQSTLQIFFDEFSAPYLVLHLKVQREVSNFHIVIGSALFMIVLTLILWLVLGRWSKRLTQRIATVSAVSKNFSKSYELSDVAGTRLDVQSEITDEIGELASTNRDLMRSVMKYNQEHFAYLQTLEILEEGVVELSPNGEYLLASTGWMRLVDELGTTIYDVIHAEDRQGLRQELLLIFSGTKTGLRGKVRLEKKNGTSWLEYRFIVGKVINEQVKSIRGVLRDITQSYQLEKRVTHMALHDSLTGLPNRVLLEDRCDVALKTTERTGAKVLLCFLDLDHFKHVNDQFGHKTGDELLVAFAAALKSTLRPDDTLSRWGGDEFVLLAKVDSKHNAEVLLNKLREVCGEPIFLADAEFHPTCSIGAALYPDDASDVETLLSQADRAMFEAKHQGRNTLCFFSEMTITKQNNHDIYIQNRLSAAIQETSLQVWYQPIMNAKTRHVVGCEALCRWKDKEYGWISPQTFVPMAESLGLIRELGRQVWQQSIKNLHDWRQRGFDIRMAINVSRRQLYSQSFAQDLLADLEKLGVSASFVDLEITESVAMEDAEHTEHRLAELAGMGFGIAIDDFGTGYSSLSQLHEMPSTKLKIDISFVRRVQTENGLGLIQAIIKVASAYGLETVAEGVESGDVADILTQEGVSQLQGYYLGKPMPEKEFEVFLASQPGG